MALQTDIATGSAHWASYLVNGDSSGMESRDIALCDAWHDRLNAQGWYVVSCEGESWFSWSYGAICGDDSCSGGELLEYVIHRQGGAQ